MTVRTRNLSVYIVTSLLMRMALWTDLECQSTHVRIYSYKNETESDLHLLSTSVITNCEFDRFRQEEITVR
jgi:hypothetical protein